MTRRRWTQGIFGAMVALALLLAAAPDARAERLCDASWEDCRQPLLDLINNETAGLDVAFWFMQDARYEQAILARWAAGVPVRVLVDPKANPSYAGNAQVLSDLAAAGIPMRMRASNAPGILHWKMMLFAGQNVVEFSGANFTPTAFVPQTPYVDYEDEVIYFSDDPSIVNSFRTEYDNLWLDTTYYTSYANITAPLTRVYPIYTKDPGLNFPQQEDYALRILKRYAAETQKIDVIMYRITDNRHTKAMIAAQQRGVPVRIISDTYEYRNSSRLWVAYNLDLLYAAGVPLRVRAHLGLNHQKLVMMYGQGMAVFGSSNWTTPSANEQQEHNYFTTKSWMFQFFQDLFERKWNNTSPVGSIETQPFTPLPPDKPINLSPANAAIVSTTGTVTLNWNGGPWGQVYDVYFGVDPNPPLFAANLQLGPTDPAKPKVTQKLALPALTPGTTYYWRVVSKTMANLTANGPTWSFTMTGTPPAPPPPPPGATTIVIWASDVASTGVAGSWQFVTDPTAAGGRALWLPDHSTSTISPPLSAPANYFETTFSAQAGVPYHVWVRMRAQNNSVKNDSVSLQFSDSMDAFGTSNYQIGSTTGAEVILQNGSSAAISGWGWADNGFGVFGPDVYFATTGTHTLLVQQRMDGAVVDQIVLSPDTYVRTPPGAGVNDTTLLASTVSGAQPQALTYPASPWQQQTVGTVAINGWATVDPSTGIYSLLTGGGDIWGSSDGMLFVYQPLSGDGSIVARVTGVPNTNPWGRAGVMIRETLTPNATNAFMYLSAGRVVALQRRLATGAATIGTAGASVSPPQWIRLDRAGNTFTGYQSSDGVNWTFVATDTVPMTASTVYVGLAATSTNQLKTAVDTIDNVTVTPGTPMPPAAAPAPSTLAAGWSGSDIGNFGFTGSDSFNTATSAFTIKGAGGDINGTADAFHFTYTTLDGDGWIIARVNSIQKTSSSAKAGVMIRETLSASSTNAFMAVTAGLATTFQRRLTTGVATTATPGSAVAMPAWVMLERVGNTFNAYQSTDGSTWTLVGSDTIAMAPTVYIGLAVTSHTQMYTSSAVFDNVMRAP